MNINWLREVQRVRKNYSLTDFSKIQRLKKKWNTALRFRLKGVLFSSTIILCWYILTLFGPERGVIFAHVRIFFNNSTRKTSYHYETFDRDM